MAEEIKMVNFGYANGWKETPGIIVECRAKRQTNKEIHDTFSNNIGRCLNEYGCRTCGYVYTVDSSD